MMSETKRKSTTCAKDKDDVYLLLSIQYLQLVRVEKFDGRGWASSPNPWKSSSWEIMDLHRKLFQLVDTPIELCHKGTEQCNMTGVHIAQA